VTHWVRSDLTSTTSTSILSLCSEISTIEAVRLELLQDPAQKDTPFDSLGHVWAHAGNLPPSPANPLKELHSVHGNAQLGKTTPE